jgi:hypothetical protein
MSKESHHKPEERDPDNEIVPRRIFFIAIGKIPEKYMINIRRLAIWALRQNPPFQFDIFVDNPNNFYKSLIENDAFLSTKFDGKKYYNINIKNVFDIVEDISKIDILEELEKNDLKKECLEGLIGLKNIAKVADILRCVELYLNGGRYFDWDSSFQLSTDSSFKKDFLPISSAEDVKGFKINAKILPDSRGMPVFRVNNDAIFCVKKHPILEIFLKNLAQQLSYSRKKIEDICRDAESVKYFERMKNDFKRRLEKRGIEGASPSFSIEDYYKQLDLKDFSRRYAEKDHTKGLRSYSRNLTTLNTTGPEALFLAIRQYHKLQFLELERGEVENLKKFLFVSHEDALKINKKEEASLNAAGIQFRTEFTGSWARGKNSKKFFEEQDSQIKGLSRKNGQIVTKINHRKNKIIKLEEPIVLSDMMKGKLYKNEIEIYKIKKSDDSAQNNDKKGDFCVNIKSEKGISLSGKINSEEGDNVFANILVEAIKVSLNRLNGGGREAFKLKDAVFIIECAKKNNGLSNEGAKNELQQKYSDRDDFLRAKAFSAYVQDFFKYSDIYSANPSAKRFVGLRTKYYPDFSEIKEFLSEKFNKEEIEEAFEEKKPNKSCGIFEAKALGNESLNSISQKT